MARRKQTFGGGPLRNLALSAAAVFVVVLGLCPALALAEEVEVEPEGTNEETVVVVQSEGVEVEAESEEDTTLQVQDLEPVPYMDWDGSQLVERTGDAACKTYTEVTSDVKNWNGSGSGSWYVVKREVTIEDNITYSGIVHLILVDGAKLTVSGKISNEGDTQAANLTIYGQKGGSGELNVTSNTGNGAALHCKCGVTINGGDVKITTEGSAVGIYAELGDVIINGGTVKAKGTNAGIYATGDSTGNVTINGGTVTATGTPGPGIQTLSNNGAVTVNGGIVKASGSNGINSSTSNRGVVINGGEVEATGSTFAAVYTGEADLVVGQDVTSFIASSPNGAWGGNPGYAELKNNVAGLGWSNAEGTADKKTIAIGTYQYNEMSAYKKIQFPLTHTITVQTDPAEGGTATAKADKAAEGKTVELEAVTADGYMFDKWTVTGEGATIDYPISPVALLTMGSADVTVTAHFKKVEPVTLPNVSVTTHVQRIGWMDAVTDGGFAGTVGKSRRMEALTLKLPEGLEGGIEYRGHVQRADWEESWAADGKVAGTEGKSLRLEAVQIQLTGVAAEEFDVYYRVHVQRIGWMAWTKNGESAGTTGMSRRAEAIQVALVKRDDPAPATTYKGVRQDYAEAFIKN